MRQVKKLKVAPLAGGWAQSLNSSINQEKSLYTSQKSKATTPKCEQLA